MVGVRHRQVPDRCDRILHTKHLPVIGVSYRVLVPPPAKDDGARTLSDHHPVVAQYTFGRDNS